MAMAEPATTGLKNLRVMFRSFLSILSVARSGFRRSFPVEKPVARWGKLPVKIQREEKAVEDDVQAYRIRPASGIRIHGNRAITKGERKMPCEVVAERSQGLPGQIRTVVGSAKTTNIAVQVQAEFRGEVDLRAQTDDGINQIVGGGTIEINDAARSLHCEFVLDIPVPHARQRIQRDRPFLAPLVKLIEAGRINNPVLGLERASQRPDAGIRLELDPVGLGVESEFLLAELEAEHGNSLEVIQQVAEAHIHRRLTTFDSGIAADRRTPSDDGDAEAPRVCGLGLWGAACSAGFRFGRGEGEWAIEPRAARV